MNSAPPNDTLVIDDAAGVLAAAHAGGDAPTPPAPLVSLADYEARARTILPPAVYAYVAGGAGDEITLADNEAAWRRLKLRPRVLVDVTGLDTSVTLGGEHDRLPFPVLLAPTAYQRTVHPDGEREVARGAGTASGGVPYIVSTSATTSIEQIAAVPSTGPLWFQLYFQPDRDFTHDLVRRVEAAGVRALCVTVDTPTLGTRDRQTRAGFVLPPGLVTPHLFDPARLVRAPSQHPQRVAVTWDDIAWLRSFTRLPVWLKGILDPDDAARAIDAGAAGVIVSNHGGRNLDTLPATADALPSVAERVEGRIPVLVDGGIRRGTDIVKALALGANAVLIGRPYLYALAVDGAAGVAHALGLLRAEFAQALALTGRPNVAAVDRSVLWHARG